MACGIWVSSSCCVKTTSPPNRIPPHSQLFKVSAAALNYSSPRQKPEAQATQSEASRLLSVCFHFSLPSVSPPPLCSYCFCLRQGLLCFSSSWPWLHKLTPDPPSLIVLPVEVVLLLPVPLLCQASILWALPQTPVFWLHCEIGARTIYSQAGVVWRTWLEDKPERGKPGSCCGWIRRMVLVGELFMSSHNLSLWGVHPASCFK